MGRDRPGVDLVVESPAFHCGIEPIRFELTSAVGGRILSIRRFNDRSNDYETSVYVIPSGENIGDRVSKIINLEMFK